jgi:hypothetical protein
MRTFFIAEGGFVRQGNHFYFKQSISLKMTGCLALGEANTRVDSHCQIIFCSGHMAF